MTLFARSHRFATLVVVVFGLCTWPGCVDSKVAENSKGSHRQAGDRKLDSRQAGKVDSDQPQSGSDTQQRTRIDWRIEDGMKIEELEHRNRYGPLVPQELKLEGSLRIRPEGQGHEYREILEPTDGN